MISSFGKKKIKGFTLLEIVMVMTVLGLLITMLIPRVNESRKDAHDVRRQADLQEVASALMKYKLDHGTFPDGIGGLDVISGALKPVGMTKIPKDPIKDRAIGYDDNDLRSPFIGIENGELAMISVTAGQYGYMPLVKNGIPNAGFVLVANTETDGGSNWVPLGFGAFEPPAGNEPWLELFISSEIDISFPPTRSEDLLRYKCNTVIYDDNILYNDPSISYLQSYQIYFYSGAICKYEGPVPVMYIHVY